MTFWILTPGWCMACCTPWCIGKYMQYDVLLCSHWLICTLEPFVQQNQWHIFQQLLVHLWQFIFIGPPFLSAMEEEKCLAVTANSWYTIDLNRKECSYWSTFSILYMNVFMYIHMHLCIYTSCLASVKTSWNLLKTINWSTINGYNIL